MNLEIASEEDRIAKMWLQHNTMLEKMIDSYEGSTERIHRNIRDINMARKQTQEESYPEIRKLLYRRDQALHRKIEIRASYNNIDQKLLAQGFDMERHVEEQFRLANLDVHDAANNSTVREYESINVVESEHEEEQKDSKASSGRKRKADT